MAGVIDNFFLAWGAPDDRQTAMILKAVAEDVAYTDTRHTMHGAHDLTLYVAALSAAGPCAAAEVVDTREDGMVRVRFHGDGVEHSGRYDVTLNDAGRIARITTVVEIT